MSEFYKDYCWKGGLPYGINKLAVPEGTHYKLPMDPYRKRVSIEEYADGRFIKIIYDSALLDFRSLKASAEQVSWEKSVIETSPSLVVSLIRNQDDRIVCVEKCLFEEAFCTECQIWSPHAIHLSTHRMFYKAKQALFDGVILYDSHNKPVMSKKYRLHPSTGEFDELIEECWEI